MDQPDATGIVCILSLRLDCLKLVLDDLWVEFAARVSAIQRVLFVQEVADGTLDNPWLVGGLTRDQDSSDVVFC